MSQAVLINLFQITIAKVDMNPVCNLSNILNQLFNTIFLHLFFSPPLHLYTAIHKKDSRLTSTGLFPSLFRFT